MAVDDHGRKRLLLVQHAVKRLPQPRKLWRRELGFMPYRGKSSRDQQLIVLAQRQVECRSETGDHFAAGRRTPDLQKAQMTLRGLGAAGELKLRPAPSLTPPPQPAREVRF